MPRQGLGAVMMWRWIKIGVEFIKALVDQRTARSHPNAPSGTEVCTAAEELRSSAHNIAVQLDSEVNIEIKCSPAQKEIERRREMVRRFFNDFWKSADDKPVTFAERLDRAQGYINERLTADGEIWQLDYATRRQLGLPPAKDRLD